MVQTKAKKGEKKTINKVKKALPKNKTRNSSSKNKDSGVSRKSSSKEFEFFEHTADVKFKAYGKTFEKALANTAKATVQVMTDVKKIKPKHKKLIKLEAKTKESLVYDFIQEIIFLIDTTGFLISEVSKIKIQNKNNIYSLTAELKGDDAKNYDVHTCIKAATYNDMEIEETKKKCTIQAVLDI